MIKHAISLTLTLFGLWLVLSGYFKPLLLGLGVASTLLVVFLALRMDVSDHESYPFSLTHRLIRFWSFLSKEIVLANIDVVKRVLGPRNKIDPQVITIHPPQRTDLGLAIYANSITLTPGTVSMEVERDHIMVHALSREGAADLQAGRMARYVPEAGEMNSKESK